jgi:hypothetical protein
MDLPDDEDRPSAFGNRVDERLAVAVGVVGGAVAAWSGASPTGSTVLDAVLLVVSVGAVVWAAASAPWWLLAVTAGVAAVTALQPVLIGLGVVAFAAALFIGVRRDHLSTLRAVVAAMTLNVLLRSELEGFFGLSAVVGVTCAVALWVFGIRRRPARLRRWGVLTTVAVVVVALFAAGLGATAMWSVRSDLELGAQLARAAISTLDDGDFEEAAEGFAQASFVLERAEDRLGGPMGLPALLVPGVAQNMRATTALSAEVSGGTAEAATALRSIDPDALRPTNGTIDLEAVAAVERPLVDVSESLAALRVVREDVDTPWLVEPLQREVDQLGRRLDDSEAQLDTAIEAVRLAPGLLGGEGERRYLVLFTSPAEARGLGGFSGNYAEITATDGRIELAEFGRTSELNRRSREAMAMCDGCPEEYLAQWGRFGADNGPGGAVGQAVWSNLTVAAHFPHVAATAQVLYPQAVGRSIDGVIVVDPFVVEAFMQYTGPIEVPELGRTVRPDNAARFILRDQYLITQDREERVDALETLGVATIEALLSEQLPRPARIARDFGPLVDERRLLMWTDDADEQALLDATGLLGALPTLGPDGGFSVSVTNAGESKIDVFLERSVEVGWVSDGDESRLVADVEFTNTAPADGLPSYVIGNSFDLPQGSSRLYVTFYGPPGLEMITRNGEPLEVSTATEAGWSAYGIYDVLGSGETAQYHLEFADLQPAESGRVNAERSENLTQWSQPLAQRAS